MKFFPARRLSYRLLFPILAVLSIFSGSAIAATSPINLNSEWLFYRDDQKIATSPSDVPAAAWSKVDLPHTARIEPRIPAPAWQGTAYYKKTIPVKLLAGERAILRFEGVMNVADVWVNGKHLGQHLGGYLPFAYDVTDVVGPSGATEVTVRINNEDNVITGPKPLKDLDYIQYGGIYRSVQLTIKPPVHITDEMLSATPAGGGVFVTFPKADKDSAVVRVKSEVKNSANETRVLTVRNSILKNGKRVADGLARVRLAAGERRHIVQELTVSRPDLWSPNSPKLYDLKTIVASGGREDRVASRIGIRRFAFEKGKLLLNGEAVFLRGVNRHQEYPYVGYALSDQADYRDALLIKKAGFDYVRLSHYPHSPAFMAAADELGLLLVNAIPGWQFFNPDPAFSRQVVQTCADLVRRDRNHPSVLAWECSLNETQMPDSLIEALHRTVHDEYPGDQAFSAGWVPQTYDIYLEARQHRLEASKAPPGKPMIVSEYGDWEYYAMNAGFNQTAWADLKPADRSSRQLLGDGERRLLQQAKNLAEAHNDNFNTPAFADGYWVMFDYNRGYAPDLEASGIMSIDRLPKFSTAFFQSQRSAAESSPRWGGGPMVFIASYWNKDSSPQVRVFSNADEIELILNGKSLGRQRGGPSKSHPHLAHPPLEFDAGAFAAGELKALAYSNGRQVATHTVRTPTEPVRLVVWRDDAGVPAADGDMVFLRAKLIDVQGTVVPENGRQVQFTVGGGYQAIGPASATTEAGIASILVRVGGARGTARARAGAVQGALASKP